MDINELIAIVKNKLEAEFVIQNLKIEDSIYKSNKNKKLIDIN